MKRSGQAWGLTTVLLCLLTLAIAPAGAGAAQSVGGPVEGGKTTIKFDKRLWKALSKRGVKVVGLQRAKVKGRSVSLPVKEGMLEPTYGSGYLFLDGAFRLKAAAEKLTVRKLVLNTAKQRLSAAVGPRLITLAGVDEVEAERTPFGVSISIGELRLTAKAAKLLGQGLGLDGVFKAGKPLGTGTAGTEMFAAPLSNASLQFSFDEGFRQKLESLEVTATGIEAGVQTSAVPLTFSWGAEWASLNRTLTHGRVAALGGIALSQGEGTTSVRLWNFGLDFESNAGTASLEARGPNGSFIPTFGPLFGQLDVRGATRIDEAARTVSMPPTVATLAPTAAATLNEAFAAGKPTQFVAGELLGAYSFAGLLE